MFCYLGRCWSKVFANWPNLAGPLCPQLKNMYVNRLPEQPMSICPSYSVWLPIKPSRKYVILSKPLPSLFSLILNQLLLFSNFRDCYRKTVTTTRSQHAETQRHRVGNVGLPLLRQRPSRLVVTQIFRTAIPATHWTTMKNQTTCIIEHIVR